jgi:hypothetical protein
VARQISEGIRGARIEYRTARGPRRSGARIRGGAHAAGPARRYARDFPASALAVTARPRPTHVRAPSFAPPGICIFGFWPDLRCVRIPVSWCRFAFCTPCERPFLGEQGSKLAVGKSPRISTIFLLYIRDKSPRIYKTNSSRQISSDF